MALSTTVDNLTGGLNRYSPERLSATESSRLQNLIHTEGGLKSIDGRNLLNQTQIIASTPVKSLYPFYKTGHRVNDTAATTKQRWTLARCGQYVWLACERLAEPVNSAAQGATSVVVTTAANVKQFPTSGTLLIHPGSGDTTPYQLAYTAKNESTGALTVSALATAIPASSTVDIVDFRPVLFTSGNTDKIGFESVNGRCYIAANGLYRWDGFYYAVGRLSCTGNTTLTGTNTTWSGYVLPGDKVYYGNGATAPHTWNGPYTVASVGSNTSITLTGNGASTSGGTWDYIIVRMHNAGIDSTPMTAPTLTATAYSGGPEAGVHNYRLVRLHYIPGTIEQEGVSGTYGYTTSSITADGSKGVQIESWDDGIGSVNSFLRIYRTAAGGATYYHVADVQCVDYEPYGDGSVSPQWFVTYQDTMPDATLTARTAYGNAVYSTPTFVQYETPTGIWSYRLTQTALTGLPPGAGTYGYCYTGYCSATDTESNPSATTAQTATGATLTDGQYAAVAITTANIDKQVDAFKIYRRDYGLTDESYYYAGQVAWNGSDATVTYNDQTDYDDLGSAVSNDHNESPDDVNRCEAFNGRMHCWVDSTYPERVWFSTVGDPEHWPRYEYGVNDPIFDDATLGGYVRCGNPGEEVTMFKPEAGSFSESGSTGANALIQTKTRAFQWWGRDWTDHRLDEAWAEGCASGDTAANCGGVLAWLSRNGPVLKPMGSPLPERVYQKLFPTLRYPFWEQVTAGSGTTDYFELSSGVYWREYYIFTWCETPSTIPNKMAMLHLPTMTYTEIGTTTYPCKAYCLSVWNGPGDNGELYYGDAENGYVWRLFAKTGTFTYWTPSSSTGVECVHRTGSILTPRTPKDLYHEKHAERWTAVFDKPTTDQTITPKVYVDGEETTATWTGSSTTISSSASGNRVYRDIVPQADGASFILEWSGTFTKTMTYQGYTFEYTEHGRKAT